MSQAISIYRIQSSVFIRWKWPILIASLMLHVAGMLIFAPQLGVSSNFFVALPVISAAMGFGLYGGLFAGMAGLPINMLILRLIEHTEYFPSSLFAAQVFGMLVGTALGALGDYVKLLNEEISRNRNLTDELSNQVRNREVLIQEVQHRVKNNLTLILSLIQLQQNSMGNSQFKEAMNIISARINAIASVHDHIYTHDVCSIVSLQTHLPQLCRAIVESSKMSELEFHSDVQFTSGLPLEKATPLSLIILEIITNSLKHAFSPEHPSPNINLTGRELSDHFSIVISDNGDSPNGAESGEKGLGTRIIPALARQIRAVLSLDTSGGYAYSIKLPKPLPSMGCVDIDLDIGGTGNEALIKG